MKATVTPPAALPSGPSNRSGSSSSSSTTEPPRSSSSPSSSSSTLRVISKPAPPPALAMASLMASPMALLVSPPLPRICTASPASLSSSASPPSPLLPKPLPRPDLPRRPEAPCIPCLEDGTGTGLAWWCTMCHRPSSFWKTLVACIVLARFFFRAPSVRPALTCPPPLLGAWTTSSRQVTTA